MLPKNIATKKLTVSLPNFLNKSNMCERSLNIGQPIDVILPWVKIWFQNRRSKQKKSKGSVERTSDEEGESEDRADSTPPEEGTSTTAQQDWQHMTGLAPSTLPSAGLPPTGLGPSTLPPTVLPPPPQQAPVPPSGLMPPPLNTPLSTYDPVKYSSDELKPFYDQTAYYQPYILPHSGYNGY
ncbi:unnamed protein product [Strongylus vulgaris]|uniref:Homeobox domain-containing protein n=1 Tax=Strongylus vulgaris TaxID=40348 RepID=A0A3P7JKN7_STRVU|nr:unnamed protein product [Strongylus vulgaris]